MGERWIVDGDRIGVALVDSDRSGRVLALNGQAERLLGLGVGSSLLDVVDGDEGARSVVAAFFGGLTEEGRRARVRTSLAGTSVELLGVVGADDTVTVVCYDLSAFDAELDQVRRAARRDPLTGLGNRLAFDDAAREAWVHAREHGSEPSVIVFDLDQFKLVNDTWGHAAGDVVLRGVGERITAVLGPDDVVARLGGDEFMVCGRDGGVPRAQAVASQVVDALLEPFDIGGASLVVAASCGIAGFDVGADIASAVQEADAAMYRAKASGRSDPVVYDVDEGDADAVAVRHLTRAVESLRRSAAIDSRTGLARDHVFAADLPALLARAQRLDGPLSLLLIDLDRFHDFNARYMYEAGHRALHAVASTIADVVRRQDRCYRYGGEEFVVLLEGAGVDAAMATADRVREAVRALSIPHDRVDGGVLTASVGVSTASPHQPCEPDWLVHGAATAVFAAKSAGRDRVHFAEPTAQPAPIGPRR